MDVDIPYVARHHLHATFAGDTTNRYALGTIFMAMAVVFAFVAFVLFVLQLVFEPLPRNEDGADKRNLF